MISKKFLPNKRLDRFLEIRYNDVSRGTIICPVGPVVILCK